MPRSARTLARATAIGRARPARVLVALTLVAAGLIAACGGGDDENAAGGVTVAPSTQTPAATVTESPTASVTATADPDGTLVIDRTQIPRGTRTPTATTTSEPTPEPTPVVTSMSELVQRFGEPPNTGYARMRIPVLGVDAPVGASLVGGDAIMTAPANPVEVTWYDMQLYPGMGGAPGQGGNAIFSGHVDYAAYVPYAGMAYAGKGVFQGLSLLSPGDVIEIDFQGQTLRYVVQWQKRVNAKDGNWASIWSANVGADSITLYTCGGDFDSVTRSYVDRVVVRAERA